MDDGSLRRYTDIPSLIYLLKNRKITLLDPLSWDDTNDSFYITLYKEKQKFKSVLALCFTNKPETYHHWSVFAGNLSGVLIKFNRTKLLDALDKCEGIKTGNVHYLTLKKRRKNIAEIDSLPFLKRYAFRDEKEFRVIFESKTEKRLNLDVPLPISCIEKITLSPWLNKSLATSLREMLKAIDGCDGIAVLRSSLVNNKEWKSIGSEELIS